MTARTLVIGNKNYSSWSLRPWLTLKVAGLPFEERLIPLDTEAFEAARPDLPAGRVPVLIEDGLRVWDSLAILEHVAERRPEAGLWPDDPDARSVARAAACEMHSGFTDLRSSMPMNLRRSLPGRGRTPGTLADIGRVTALWRACRERFGAGGPFLFGRFTNADAMFAPVAARFRTYAVELDPTCAAYVEAVLTLPAMRAWYAAAEKETWVVAADEIDDG